MDVGQRFADLLRLLAGHGVELVVVGAAAAVLDGAPMTTFDLDVVFEPGAANRARLLAALADLDAVYWDPVGQRIRPTAERLAEQRLHLLETRLGRLDLLREIGDSQGWEQVRARSHAVSLPGVEVRVLDLEAVIESKEAAGRPKDRAALPLLRETLRLRRHRASSHAESSDAPMAGPGSPAFALRPCVDSAELAARRRRELELPSDVAASLGHTALDAVREGVYRNADGEPVAIGPLVAAAMRARVSIPPDAALPAHARERRGMTRIQVANETTMAVGRRLVDAGCRTLALNFANGVSPGGGFLDGARAQEEVLCRSSALFATLEGDPMYAAHRSRGDYESSDSAILSPDVPFFREDDGAPLPAPWLLSVLTCAAPVAKRVGQPRAGDLLARRIERVLAIAEAWGYVCLVLGAWGCGAFGNDPVRTARDFRTALEGPFRGVFREVVFAITDWSPERRFLGPFRDAFGGGHELG